MKGLKKAVIALIMLTLVAFIALHLFIYNHPKNYHTFYNATKGYDVKYGQDWVTNLRDGMLNIPIKRFTYSEPNFPVLEFQFTKDSYKDVFDSTLQSIRSANTNLRHKKKYIYVTLDSIEGEIRIHGNSAKNWAHEKVNFKYIVEEYACNFKSSDSKNNLVPLYIHQLCKQLSIPYSMLNPVFIESEFSEGLYYLEERLDGKFLYRNNYDSCLFLKLNDSWMNCPNCEQVALHNLSNVKKIDRMSPDNQAIIHQFFSAIGKEDLELLWQLLDKQEMANYEALRMLIAGKHDFYWDNQKWIIDTAKQTIHPVYRCEGNLDRLRWNDKSLFSGYNDPLKDEDHQSYKKLYYLLHSDSEFLALKNEALFNLLQSKNELIDSLEAINEKYFDVFCYQSNGPKPITFRKEKMLADKEIIEYNMSLIDEYLNKGVIHIDVFGYNQPSIINQFNVPIKVQYKNGISDTLLPKMNTELKALYAPFQLNGKVDSLFNVFTNEPIEKAFVYPN